jgi:hypothetical protein
MSMLLKSMAIGGSVFAITVTAANAASILGGADPATQQLAAQPSGILALPEIFISPAPNQDPRYYDPYTSGHSQHASSLNNLRVPHYKVPVGYDSMMAMHPYTSLIGPCTEGATPSQGCRHASGAPIQPSHYERPPFNQ